jgi:ABC-2 type transport system permease protein
MNKMILVMASEIRTTLRRKSFTLFAFGLPLVLGIVVLIVAAVNRDAATALIANETETPAVVEQVGEGYVDQGGLISTLPSDIPSDWLTEYPDEAAAQAALEAEEISAYYVIPADYVETGEIIYAQPEYSVMGGSVNTDGMLWILLVNMLDGDTELAAQAWKPFDAQVTQLASSKAGDTEDSWFTELLPQLMTIILYMAIILPSGVLVSAVTDEKKNRVLEVLMSSVSPQQMITGKILGVGLLGLLQTALWVGVLWMVVRLGGQPLKIPAGFELPTQLLIWSLVYFLLGYGMYGALLAGVGALAPDVKDTKGASFAVMSPLIAVYVFVIVIITNPNGLIALMVSLFPLTSPVGMIARMTAGEVPWWQLALAAALQLLAAIFIVRLVARLFRAQHLLSGQPFNVPRFMRALAGRA